MNKSYLLIFTVLLIIGRTERLFPQSEKFLKVTYKKDILSTLDNNKNTKAINKINSEVITESENLNYELIIQRNKSWFKLVKSMEADNKKLNFKSFAENFGGTKGEFHLNITDSIFINERMYGGQRFNVELPVKNWVITKESKYINNILCYKAISEDILENSRGEFKFQVIAWFTPELPSFFGPSEYFGLPGLILELNNGKVSLKVISIESFNSEEEIINPLKKGVRLNKKEFNLYVKKTVRTLLEERTKN